MKLQTRNHHMPDEGTTFFRIIFTLADDERPQRRVAYIRARDEQHAREKLPVRYHHRASTPVVLAIDLAEGEFITD